MSHVEIFLSAARALIDPHRRLLAQGSPYVLMGGGPAGMRVAAAGAQATALANADLMYLEFAPGREADGPMNVVAALTRGGAIFVRRTCRLWVGAAGGVALVAETAEGSATMTFDPDGMDSRPGRPAGPLKDGYARAAVRLARLAVEERRSGKGHRETFEIDLAA